MAGFKELNVWVKSVQLSIKIYELTKTFPREEQFGLTNQMRRASTSVPANIAEGWSRNSEKSFRYFLDVAKGSLSELITFLIITEALGYITKEKSIQLQNESDEISKMIYRLKTKIKITV